MIWIKAAAQLCGISNAMWRNIALAPFDSEVELAVINDSVNALEFPCLRTEDGWLNAVTLKEITVAPTHWRSWPAVTYFCCCG